MTVSLFGLTGYGYGLAAGGSALLALGAGLLLRKKTGTDPETLLWYFVLGLPLGLVFSRALFCAVNYEYFVKTIAQPLRMLSFWDGGFSMAGLLLGLVLAALLTARLRKLPPRKFLDTAALPLGLLIAGLRLAEGLTEALGIGRHVEAEALADALPVLFVTESLGTMQLHRLAVYRYEAAFALLVFLLALWFTHASKRRKDGDTAMLVFALYGAGQVLFESMRDDGHMVLGFIRVQQVLGLLCVLTVLGVLCARYGRQTGARQTVTTAWLLPPVMAVILVMMVWPINHVLDLSGHIGLGIALLAACGVYLAFFLRTHGASPRLILTWLLALLLVAACVMLEFSMDGSDNILRDYGLLALCCAALLACPAALWRALPRTDAS